MEAAEEEAKELTTAVILQRPIGADSRPLAKETATLETGSLGLAR